MMNVISKILRILTNCLDFFVSFVIKREIYIIYNHVEIVQNKGYNNNVSAYIIGEVSQ